MKIPAQLKHKPVIVSEDYDRIDGRNSGSEAKGLSLGLAQWNERGKVDISAKIWRHTGGKWSRQSEEMPLHRVLDLAILICRSRLFFLERYKKDKSDHALPDRIGLQGGAMNVAVCEQNEHIGTDMELFDQALHNDDEILSERFSILHGLLEQIKTL
ncbi:MAG: hypothetical protein K0B52_01735 [FCB group bacterium]|nr:hypothetical protein [FCB group bacterium]